MFTLSVMIVHLNTDQFKTSPEALMVQLLLPQLTSALHWTSEFPECISKLCLNEYI